MLSSGPGVRASGASSSLNSQNSNPQHETTHFPQQLGAGILGAHPDLLKNDDMNNGRGAGPSSQGFSSPFDSNNWFNYTAQTFPQHHSASPSVSPAMIGPTSTLYDPDASLQQPDAVQAYQQWINQYNDQQQYGRGMIHYTDHLQNYSSFAYPESITDTVTPPTVSQYQQQNILYDSYRSELLIATGLMASANTTLSSRLDTQAYQQSTPDLALNSYTSPPNSQVLPTSCHLPPQLTQNSMLQMLQREQPVSQRESQQHFLAGFEAQCQGTTVPQTQETTNVPSHEHQLPFPSSSSQPHYEGQNGPLSANQHPSSPVQQSPQEPGNNVRGSNLRKQLQESGSPYTTNQLNIQGPGPSSRPGQAYGNQRTSPRANACGTGRGISFGGSQSTQSPSKLGASKGSPRHSNATSQDPSIPVDSSSKRRKRDYEGNFISAGGDAEGESDGEEGDGLTGGIEIGLGGLGVENIDGQVEKGGQRPYVISTHAEAHILTDWSFPFKYCAFLQIGNIYPPTKLHLHNCICSFPKSMIFANILSITSNIWIFVPYWIFNGLQSSANLLPTNWCYLHFLPVLCIILLWVLGRRTDPVFWLIVMLSDAKILLCFICFELDLSPPDRLHCAQNHSIHWIMESRPGACKHCKKLKVRNYTFVICEYKASLDLTWLAWYHGQWVAYRSGWSFEIDGHNICSSHILLRSGLWLSAISDDMYHASCGAFQRWGLTDSNTRWSAIFRRMTTLASDVKLAATCVSWKVVSPGQHQSEWGSVLFPDFFSSISRWICRQLK